MDFSQRPRNGVAPGTSRGRTATIIGLFTEQNRGDVTEADKRSNGEEYGTVVAGERGRNGEGGRVGEVYLAERKVADQKISGSNVAELRRPEATTKDPRSDIDKRVPHLDLFFFLFLSVHSSIFSLLAAVLFFVFG